MLAILRLTIGLFLPTILGVLCLVIPFNMTKYLFSIELWAVACLLMLIPSILYTMLMEFVINPRIKKHSDAIFSSAGLGLILSMPFALISLIPPVMSLPTGTIVGLIVGVILRFLYWKGQKKDQQIQSIASK